ncbi:DUF3631 domain-containing protein, partial [Streptomyces sp. NPDC005385]|uniref:DUF3631 domain-containing protein n=1 Tax=Streptomyces sp. NPDC005385 TaxID=3157039 RepID=UPI0033B6F225
MPEARTLSGNGRRPIPERAPPEAGISRGDARNGAQRSIRLPEEERSGTWEPLIIVADLAGDIWPKLAREAALKIL